MPDAAPQGSIWLWIAPLIALALVVALMAFRLGWIRVHLSESAAIDAYAARYVAQAGEGARASDCAAFPGREVWLVVRCGAPGAYRGYFVNRFGGLRHETGPGDWPGDAAPRAPST